MNSQQSPEDLWGQLQPDALHALKNLLSEITDQENPGHGSPQSLFEAYTYAKKITARAIQSRMLLHLPTENKEFRELHTEIQRQMTHRYESIVPGSLLRAHMAERLMSGSSLCFRKINHTRYPRQCSVLSPVMTFTPSAGSVNCASSDSILSGTSWTGSMSTNCAPSR